MLPIIILAGGLATRLKPITETIPKSMVEILGRPFIDWQLELLSDSGFEQVIISVSYRGEQIENYVGTGQKYGLNIKYVYDGDSQLGTGGAISKASKFVAGDFAVMYGDSYLPIDFKAVEEVFSASNQLALMTIFKNDNSLDASNVEFIDGRLVRYSKQHLNEQMHHIDYGLEYFRKSVFADSSDQTPWDLAEILEKLVINRQVVGYPVSERFFEVGSFQGIRDLESYLKGRTK